MAVPPFSDAKLEHDQLVGTSGEFVRDIWCLRGPLEKENVLGVFLDGEHYLRDLRCASIITQLVQEEAISPMSCVFVSHLDSAARHADFTCNPRYGEFIARDVVDWARKKAGVRKDQHLICGLSLSGLASAHIALQHPDVFSACLAQSGSFWWSEDRSLELPHTHGRFWLSVGDQEAARHVKHPPTGMIQTMSQLDGVRAMVRRLETLGGTTRLHEYSGGHAATPWREELPDALRWLMPRVPTARTTGKNSP